MKKKLTRSSFCALRETVTLLDEREQRAVIGGDYWDDYGVWATDSSGNMYWTRTSDGDGGSYYGDSGYGTGSGIITQDQFFNWSGDWPGGYVEGMGYVPADTIIYGGSGSYGGSGYYDGNSYPNLTDGVDYGNSGHFTFNTSGNTAFQNQLTSILGSNSVIGNLLSFFDRGYVHMTFGMSGYEQVGSGIASAYTSYSSQSSYNINFNSNFMDDNGWNNPYDGGNNIGYDYSKARNMEEKLIITLVHEAMHANHTARYHDAIRSAGNRRPEAVQFLKDNGYSDDFIAMYFERDATGAWVDADVNQRVARQHAYFEKYNHGVIDAALEEYRRDHGY